MAKRFDYESIYDRRVKKALEMGELTNIVSNGIFDTLLKTESYGEAELARYLEYLLQERKFSTARNLSSLMAQAELVCYKRSLPISAQGFVIVTHTDDNGINRANNYLKSFTDINSLSDFDDIIQDTKAGIVEKSALVPWLSNKVYTIPEGTCFTSSSGTKFFSTEEKVIKTWNKEYSQILTSSRSYDNFLEQGGWEGYKYLKIPVIQGIRKTEPLGISDATPNQVFKLNIMNVEDASNSVSKKYFYVTTEINGSSERWEETYSVSLAGDTNSFQKKILPDSSGIEIKFGNGSSGRIPPKDAKIYLHYVESLGSEGNISKKNTINSMSFNNQDYNIDPRTGNISNFLQCFNNYEIMGGKDLETIEEIRENAPLGFLRYKSLSTAEDYKEIISRKTPIGLIHLKTSRESSQAQNEIVGNICIPKKYNNVIYYTGLKYTGEKLTSSEATNITETILNSISNTKLVGDDIQYAEPDIVDFDVSLDVGRRSGSSVKADDLDSKIFNNFSIYAFDFAKPLINSEIVDLVKDENLDFSDVEFSILGSATHYSYYSGTDTIEVAFSFNDLAKSLNLAGIYEAGFSLKVDIESSKNSMTVLLCPTAKKEAIKDGIMDISSVDLDEEACIADLETLNNYRNVRLKYKSSLTNKEYLLIKDEEIKKYYQDTFNRNSSVKNNLWINNIGISSFDLRSISGVFQFSQSDFLTLDDGILTNSEALKTYIENNINLKFSLRLLDKNIYTTSDKMIFNVKNTNIYLTN